MYYETYFKDECLRESILGITFDYLSSFISNYFNFLQQKKVYETFNYIFNEKLNILINKNQKFGKKHYGLIHDGYSEEVGNSMERVLLNSIFKKGKQNKEEHDLLKSYLEGSNIKKNY